MGKERSPQTQKVTKFNRWVGDSITRWEDRISRMMSKFLVGEKYSDRCSQRTIIREGGCLMRQ